MPRQFPGSTKRLTDIAAGAGSIKRTAGASIFAGAHVGGGLNDGAGGIITIDDKANALLAYQRVRAHAVLICKHHEAITRITAEACGNDWIR